MTIESEPECLKAGRLIILVTPYSALPSLSTYVFAGFKMPFAASLGFQESGTGFCNVFVFFSFDPDTFAYLDTLSLEIFNANGISL